MGGEAGAGNATDRERYVDAALVAANGLILLSTAAVGLAANIFVILAVYNQKSLQTWNNTLVVNLAVIDALRCAVDCPVLFAIVLTVHRRGRAHQLICDAQVASFSFGCCIQLLTLACISAERYQAIAAPFKTGQRKRRIMVLIPLTWILAILTAAVCLLFLKDSPVHVKCSGLRRGALYYDTFGLYMLLPLWAACFSVIIAFYTRIFLHVRSHNRKIYDKGTFPLAKKEATEEKKEGARETKDGKEGQTQILSAGVAPVEEPAVPTEPNLSQKESTAALLTPTGARGSRTEIKKESEITGGAAGEQGAATKEGAATSQGVAGKRGAATKQGAVTKHGGAGERGAVMEQGAVKKQGAATKQGMMDERGAATKKGAAGEQGAATKKGAAGEQGAATKKEVAGEQGAPIKQGVAGELAAVIKQGAAGEPGAPRIPATVQVPDRHIEKQANLHGAGAEAKPSNGATAKAPGMTSPTAEPQKVSGNFGAEEAAKDTASADKAAAESMETGAQAPPAPQTLSIQAQGGGEGGAEAQAVSASAAPPAETDGAKDNMDVAGAVCMMPSKASKERANKKKESKMAKRAGYIILTFLIFWLPLIATILGNFIVRSSEGEQVGVVQDVEILSVSIACITSLSDPIIYAAVNPQFRMEFYRIRNQVRSVFNKK